MNQPPGPALTLYFVADNPGTEHNRDLFTWATPAEEATDDWQNNYETRERPEGVFGVPTANPKRGVVAWDVIRTEALS